MNNNGLLTFQLFMALKLHFTKDSYDFLKSGPLRSMKQETFILRNDRFYFTKLADRYSIDEMRDFFIANLLVNTELWVGDMLTSGEDTYLKWMKTKQSLSYTFENDLVRLMDSVDTPNALLKVEEGQFPILLTESMGGRIALESMLILESLMGFFSMWEKKIDDDIIWPQYYLKCIKYLPFIDYDKEKYKKIVLKTMRI